MIVWLASYPKSGNTLVRALLSSYFFSNDGIFNFDIIKNIKQFPHIGLFENLGIDVKNEKEVIKNYVNAQASINKKDSIQFCKTHSYLFNIDNSPFTDLNNSLGAIYIVRDPRNVVTSYAHHNREKYRSSSEIIPTPALFAAFQNWHSCRHERRDSGLVHSIRDHGRYDRQDLFRRDQPVRSRGFAGQTHSR